MMRVSSTSGRRSEQRSTYATNVDISLLFCYNSQVRLSPNGFIVLGYQDRPYKLMRARIHPEIVRHNFVRHKAEKPVNPGIYL